VTGRYDRQMLVPWVGPEGQARIAAASVGIVGVGALGCTSAALLARAGVGHLVLVDRDLVEETNLQRQLLFTEAHVAGRVPKARAACEALRAARAELDADAWDLDLGPEQARELFARCDLVLDGTDNYETRFLLNDASVESAKPWIYAGAVSTYGAVLVVRPGEGPCLRCLFPTLPPPASAPTCDIAGVLGPAASAVASLQASEALKLLAGRPDLCSRGMVQFELTELSLRVLPHPRDGGCPCCSRRQFDFLEEREGSRTHRLCGRDSVMVLAPRGTRLDLPTLEARLSAFGPVFRNPYLLQTVWEEHPVTLYADGRAMIQGTKDPVRARALYARFLGM